ncbi:TonB-dependent receptor [Capnocytophaga felis]|uniref:TonB-dependent receptor n=1 Tax=Capnocytophaga felis TaxID=2267611 RepID=A0A5M4B924_9FLAO|nr:TonB-dependent receptor [Capnocytophaga felis]GET46111.1 TonB-dependent receptor [Capnocytophaga felis]GET48903.1 TonB-dependent receptor [Capnocytophaga felis]
MKNHLFIFLLLLGVGVFAQNGTLKGNVSSQGNSLESVSVQLENKFHKKWAISDKKGNFEISVPEGSYNLKVSSLGFVTVTEKITIKSDEVIERNFELKEDVLGINEVVVTATKTELNRKEAPVLVSVTGQKDLVAVRARTLMEGLVFQPGLRTEVNCQNCGFSQVRINGLEGAYSQILIDSRPIFGSLNGVYGLEQIPTNMIERIEVIRGGGSALFGANAIAGTINVITKNPTKNEAQAGVLAALIGGESEDIVSSFNGSIVNDNLSRGISFYGTNRIRDSYDANGDGLSELTKLRNINAGAKFFNEFNSRKKLVGELNVSNENRRGGNKFDEPEHLADIAESIRTDMVGGNINYDYLSPSYNHKLSAFASGQRTKANNYYGAFDTENNTYDVEALNYGVTRENIWVIGGQHTAQLYAGEGSIQWTSGAEYKFDKISENRRNPEILTVNQDQNIFGLYTQADWKIHPNFKFLAGVRLDNVSSNLLKKSVTAINPRASLLYNVTDEIIARASYARGFRAPLFYSEDVHSELITGEVRRVQLASDLKKETSDSFTTSFEYNRSRDGHQLVAMIEGFFTALHNPFVYTSVGKENELDIREKQNGDKAIVKGVNLEFKYSPDPKFALQLGATFQSSKHDKPQVVAEDENGNVIAETDKLLRSPNAYGNLTATYKPREEWAINLTTVFTGSMETFHEGKNELVTTPNMFDFGLNTSYEFRFDNFFTMEVSAGIKNLFNDYQKDFDKGIDRDPTYIYGPSLPRTLFAGLKVRI